MLAIAIWFQWFVALFLFLAILLVGMSFLRSLAGGRQTEKVTPEDVKDLDVFFVCDECGTEYQVTVLGEVQVPRHCGEPMQVVRRPRQQPLSN